MIAEQCEELGIGRTIAKRQRNVGPNSLKFRQNRFRALL